MEAMQAEMTTQANTVIDFSKQSLALLGNIIDGYNAVKKLNTLELDFRRNELTQKEIDIYLDGVNFIDARIKHYSEMYAYHESLLKLCNIDYLPPRMLNEDEWRKQWEWELKWVRPYLMTRRAWYWQQFKKFFNRFK